MDTPELGAAIGNFGGEAKDGMAQLGPDVPAQADQSNPLVMAEMSEEDVKAWLKRIELSDARIKKESEVWKALLGAYIPLVKGQGVAETVKTNGHFRNVHTKLGQMFVEAPEVRMEPAPDSPADQQKMGPNGMPIQMSDIISIKQSYLNKKLGRDGIKVKRLFDELVMDILSMSGIGCSKLGYRAVTQDVQKPVMGPDPTFVPPQQPMGSVLGLAPTPQAPQVPQMDPMTGQPKLQKVTVVVHEEVYWRRFSPYKYVSDVMLTSTRHDEDATFQGMHFSMMPSQAMAAFGLTDDEVNGAKQDELRFKHKKDGDTEPVITGVEIFAKASYFIEGEIHPWKLVQIVFLDHIKDRPVVYRFSPDQTFTEDGELTEDSIDRFPIRVCTIRDLPDSQLPQADSAFTNNLVKQLDTNRQQGVALRDGAIGKILYDTGALEDGDVSKVQNAKPGAWIGVAEGRLEKGVQAVAAQVAQPVRSNDDYRLDAMLQQNMDETLGISANSSGASEDTVRSATEIQTIQRAVLGRNRTEQGRIIDHFLDGVRLIDILITRYTTTQQWAKVTGPNGAAVMQAWTGEMVSGRWVYDIAPDSQLQVDTAQDRQQNLNFYNLIAKDPLVNRVPILQKLARQFGYDPNKIIINPALMPAQPPHGGTGEMVNDHEAAKSGGKENAPQ